MTQLEYFILQENTLSDIFGGKKYDANDIGCKDARELYREIKDCLYKDKLKKNRDLDLKTRKEFFNAAIEELKALGYKLKL